MEPLIEQLRQLQQDLKHADAERMPARLQQVLSRVGQLDQAAIERLDARSQVERCFKVIFDRAALGIAIAALPDFRLTLTNPAFRSLTGFEADELARMRLDDLTVPEDRPLMHRLIEALLAGTQEDYQLEKRYRRKDDRKIWVSVIGSLLRDEAGSPRAVLGLVEDITERKRQQVLVGGQLRILEQIARNAPLLETLESITRLIEGESEGMLASILLLDDQGQVHYGAAPSLPESYNRAIEGAHIGPMAGSCGSAMFLKQTIVTRDIATDPRWDGFRELALLAGLHSSWSTPLLATEGKVLGSLALYYREPRDPAPADMQLVEIAKHLAEIAIERQQAEESLRGRTRELERANVRLEELDRLKSNFVNMVSHELRTPLTSIRGYAEFLEDHIGGALSPEQDGYVAQIQEGATRLQVLLNDLLDFARLDAGTFKLSMEETDLSQKIHEVLRSLEPLARQKQLILETALPAEAVVLMMDPGRIGQILINLIGNALKFTQPGGRICVSLAVSPQEARVEVHDTGIGIAPEHLPHLFERFFQVDPSNTRQVGGTGLGLSISKALVEAHGGRIGVEAQGPQGSTFWFTLPRAAPLDLRP